MTDDRAGASRMPIGPCDAARRARLLVPAGSGVVVAYISGGLSVMRTRSAPDEDCFSQQFEPSGGRSSILIRVVATGETLTWPSWERWHQGLALCWGSTVVDVLVASPTQWRSVLTPR